MDDVHRSIEDRWAVARTNSNEQPVWLARFDADQPVWVASIDEAAIYGHHDADRVRLRCTNMLGLDDVLYAVCRLKRSEWLDASGCKPRTN